MVSYQTLVNTRNKPAAVSSETKTDDAKSCTNCAMRMIFCTLCHVANGRWMNDDEWWIKWHFLSRKLRVFEFIRSVPMVASPMTTEEGLKSGNWPCWCFLPHRKPYFPGRPGPFHRQPRFRHLLHHWRGNVGETLDWSEPLVMWLGHKNEAFIELIVI